MLYILNKGMGSVSGIDFELLRYLPAFGILPVIFALVFIIFLYGALKINNYSKFSFWWNIISLIIIPIPLSFAVLYMISHSLSSELTAQSSYFASPVKTITDGIKGGNIVNVIQLIVIILLIISSKKLSSPNEPLSIKNKIIFLLFFIIAFVPSVIYPTYGFIKTLNTDYGYTQAQNQVTYHIYKPTTLPSDLVYALKYQNNTTLGESKNAVKTGFDVPLDKLIKEGKGKAIILQQAGIDQSFNFEDYLQPMKKDSTSIQEVNISVPKNGKAFLITKSFVKLLTFTTADDVLILLVSPRASNLELITIANNLQ